MESEICLRTMAFWWMARKFPGLLRLETLKVSVVKRLILPMEHCCLD